MELQPADLLNKFYPSLDELVKVFNTFASLQGYIIVKKHTKVSKKGIFRKAVLIFDKSKKHIDENRGKRDIRS